MAFDISRLNEKADLSGGQWVDDIDDNPGVRLKVRSSNYKPFQNEIDRLRRKAGKTGIKAAPLGEAIAKHLLIDWDFSEGAGPIVLEQDGKIVEYREDIALAVLMADDDYGIGTKFRDAVWGAANTVADNLLSTAEEAAGN